MENQLIPYGYVRNGLIDGEALEGWSVVCGFCFLAGGKGKEAGKDNGEYDGFSHCLSLILANIVIFL